MAVDSPPVPERLEGPICARADKDDTDFLQYRGNILFAASSSVVRSGEYPSFTHVSDGVRWARAGVRRHQLYVNRWDLLCSRL